MAKYFLTERAAIHLRDIYDYSVDTWGEDIANAYMAKVIKKLQQIAQAPGRGIQRQHRSSPFLMAPTEKHFAVYKQLEQGIIVAAMLHGTRDIEKVIARITPALAEEINKIEGDTQH